MVGLQNEKTHGNPLKGVLKNLDDTTVTSCHLYYCDLSRRSHSKGWDSQIKEYGLHENRMDDTRSWHEPKPYVPTYSEVLFRSVTSPVVVCVPDSGDRDVVDFV